MRKIRSFHYDHIDLVKKICQVQKVIDDHRKDTILFWGCGKNMEIILECCDLNGIDFKICDSFYYGKGYKNGKIEEPNEELVDWANIILVTAFYNAEAIIDGIKQTYPTVTIKSIFEDEKEPLYRYSVEMTAECRRELITEKEYGTQNRYIPWKVEGMGASYEKAVERNLFDIAVKDLYLQWIKENDFVLDVGAGTGRLSIEIEKKGAIVTAVDTSEEMLNELRKKTKGIKTIKVDDGYELPFESNTFDVTVSCDAMIHFINWRDFFREHIRVTKNGGYIVYNMYNSDHLKRISENKWLGEAYMSDCGGYGISVSREELEKECKISGDVELIKMIPHMFFKSSAYTYGIMTHEEMFDFSSYISEMCGENNVKHIIKAFEKDVVNNQKEDICAMNIIVFRKL